MTTELARQDTQAFIANLDAMGLALAAARDNAERLQVRNQAAAFMAYAARQKEFAEWSTHFSLLVNDAERAIVQSTPHKKAGRKANPEIAYREQQLNNHQIKPGVLNSMRRAHANISDEEYNECKRQALDNQEPLSRRSLTEISQQRIKDEKRERNRQTDAAKAAAVRTFGNGISLYHSPIADLPQAAGILPNSIDAIITDPPYPGEYLDCYNRLAEFASEYLKDDGVMVVMAGVVHLPQVMMRLDHPNLRWCFELDYRDNRKTNLRIHNLLLRRKPLLVYGGKSYIYKGGGHDDIVTPDDDDTRSRHQWAQSDGGIEAIMRKFCRPGMLVVDPFVGGGSSALAAYRLGCWFIGGDMDEEWVNHSWYRLAEAGYGSP